MPRIAVADGGIRYEEAGRGQPLIFVSGLNGGGHSISKTHPDEFTRLVMEFLGAAA
ncbi:MAG: hypothetical protein HY526_01175 [Betaproteobacteria bacterium]|nr:hypothetical protein [Betaproteobacteria bacterium]